MDFNVSPYYDDLDPRKDFLAILFRGSYPVQVRELNQVQSLTALQIKRFADHIFEEGAMVIPGNIAFDTKYTYVKVQSNSNLDSESYRNLHFFDKEDIEAPGGVLSNPAGVKARVVWHTGPNESNEITFYIKYISSDTSTGTQAAFVAGQTLTLVGSAITCTVVASNAVGTGSSASIKEGVYYIRGRFVRVETQNIILDGYTNSPSYRVGLDIQESIITPDDPTDGQSLLDNAQGRPNYAAPGAHRYRIRLALKKLPLDSFGTEESENFVELLRLTNGLADRKVETTDYSIIEQTLARRTKDESGDYTVKPFNVGIREFYSDGTNGGLYVPSDFSYATIQEAKDVSVSRFGVTSPGEYHTVSSLHRPCASPQALIDAMRAKLIIEIDSGVAYVDGYEIRKISKSYMDLNKARQFEYLNNQSIQTPLGNYVLVTNLCNTPDIKNFTTVSLRNTPTASRGTQASGAIGTARVRGIEYDSGSGTTAIYRLYLFDIRVDTGFNFFETKQISNASGFTSDVILSEIPLPGAVSVTSGAAAVTGNMTQFTSDPINPLVAGDYIRVRADNGTYLTVKVLSIASDRALTLAANASATVTNSAYSYVFAELRETYNNALIFQLPRTVIRALKSSGDVSHDTNYFARREFAAVAVGSNQITIQTNSNEEEFVAFSSSDYIATYTTGNGGVTAGDIVALSASTFSLSQDATYATISGLTNSNNVKVIATVRKKTGNAAGPKTKTIANLVLDSTVSLTDLKTVSLGKADIIRVNKITMSADFTTAALVGDTDITSRYTLDNGQRDNLYDIGKLVLNPGAPSPTGRIRIDFDYFQHGVNGNYFCVDSYTVIAGFDYGDIPVYTSTESGYTYNLRDCLDFRPRVNDAGTGYDNTTGSLVEVPNKNSVSADFSYYLNRIDKLYLAPEGNFALNVGIYGRIPPPPDEPLKGMVTHQLNVRAYTRTTQDVIVDFRENKRFTMRQIGQLEDRIAKLEYYTQLNLLEKNTADLEIKDEAGLDRFKLGFMVDSFKGHNRGDVQNPDYRCSMDFAAGIVRPQFVEDYLSLAEVNTTTQDRTDDNYTKFASTVSIKTTGEQILVQQPLASSYINVNPFNVISFLGSIVLDPPSDEWKDTEQAPDLIVNQEGSYDSISQMVNGMGTIWGEWQDTWYGQPVTTIGPSVTTLQASTVSQQHRTTDGALDTNGGFNVPGTDFWPVRTVTTTRSTTTVAIGQSRVGLQANVTPKTVTTDLGNKVINVAYIPFIRTRNVLFYARGLKPRCRVYPFFDNTAVSGYCKPTSGNDGDPLITDATGKVSGTITIPNNSALKFRTGERIFRLTSDSANLTPPTLQCSANAVYRAQGLLETQQNTILSVRNADVAWDQVSDTGTRTQRTDSTTVEFGQWVDPVSQIFKVVSKGGAFLSKVRLYFQAKDPDIPVTLQIREVVNGYPGTRVLPFSEVVKDSADINISEDGATATDFVFTDPIHLLDGADYALVLLTNSNKYYVWYAVKGENLIGTEIPIEENPYAGSFFKSENSSTWIADPLSDLKFNIFQYQFDTSGVASIDFADTDIPVRTLVQNPIITTNGSKRLRVLHPNHGMHAGGKVTISGVAPNNTPTNTKLNNILLTNINTTHTIVSAELDSYTITVSGADNANLSSTGGGSAVKATRNMAFDTIHTVVSEMVPGDCKSDYYLKTTSGRSIDGDQAPYSLASAFIPIAANNDATFTAPQLIASPVNEAQSMVTGAGRSLFLRGQLRTSNVNVSPIIDLARIGVATVSNRLNNPSPYVVNIDPIDYKSLLTGNDKLVFDATTSSISTSDSSAAASLSPIQKGRYVKISGANKAPNNGIFRIVTAVYDSGANTFSMVVGENDGQALGTNPLTTSNSSEDISVSHTSHKLVVGSTIIVTGSQSVGGIPAENINGARIVTAVADANTYTFKANTRATSSSVGGGSNITITPGGGTLADEGKTLGNNPFTTTNTSTTVTVAHTAHGLKTGDSVVIRGATGTGGIIAGNLNGTRTITVTNANTYTFVAAAAATSDSTGGGNVVIVSAAFSVYYLNNYVDEKAPQHGSNAANYITKRVVLAAPANGLHISLAAFRHTSAFIDVYYKISKVDSSAIFDEIEYERAVLDGSVPASTDPNEFKDYTYTIDNLPDFTSYSIKVCMRGTNTSLPPQARDFRAIALGT